MALWTDNLFPTAQDLSSIAPDLQYELTSETTTGQVTSLLQFCHEAYSHCGSIIASKLQSVIGATNFNPSGGATSLHNAAVIWGVRAQSSVVRIRLSQIVMNDLYQGTDQWLGAGKHYLKGPLHQWMAYWGVVLAYRQLIGRATQSMDRYNTKYNNYRRITSNEKWSLLRSTGIPYIRLPLPAPGAIFEQGYGTWSAANNLAQVTQAGTAAAGPYFVAITWVCQTGTANDFYISPTNKQNSESGPSQVYPTNDSPQILASITLIAGNALQVGIANLTPPSGMVPLAEASITGVTQGTMIATGWNLYVGLPDDQSNPGTLYLQNALPIPVAQTTYTLATDPVLSGYTMGPGQYPDANMPVGDLMMRM